MTRWLWAALLVGCAREEHAAPAPQPEVGVIDSGRSDTTVSVDGALDGGDDSSGDEVEVDTGAPDTRFASLPPWPDADVSLWMTGPDAAPACDDAATDAEPGTRFCELYRDFFSHGGAASCQTYGCHGGDRGQQGLALGWTPRSMYDAMVAFKTWIEPKNLLVPVPGGDSRPVSALGKTVDATNGYFMPFLMPELGNRKLTDAEIGRINAWLARGAPFD